MVFFFLHETDNFHFMQLCMLTLSLTLSLKAHHETSETRGGRWEESSPY
jgi:hypothetical protein